MPHVVVNEHTFLAPVRVAVPAMPERLDTRLYPDWSSDE